MSTCGAIQYWWFWMYYSYMVLLTNRQCIWGSMRFDHCYGNGPRVSKSRRSNWMRCPTYLDNSGGIPLRVAGFHIVSRDYTTRFRAMPIWLVNIIELLSKSMSDACVCGVSLCVIISHTHKLTPTHTCIWHTLRQQLNDIDQSDWAWL